MAAKPKVFRDPVHDIIDFKRDGARGRLAAALIDTRELQRLRHIRQLGLASFVFHGAEHSRFSHSVGVAHVGRRMVDALDGMDELTSLAVLGATLLHDTGHGPFSHVLERVFSFHHEDYSVAIASDPDTEAHRALAELDPQLPARVAELIRGEGDPVARQIVSSQLDADRFDYLLRDAHMTGVEVGRYDLERILVLLDADSDGLIVDVRAFEAVEGYLISRYHMYRLVYFHHAARAAESMLEAAFRRARWLMRGGDTALAPQNALGALMRGEAVGARAYTSVADYDAWSLLARWQDHRDPVLARLARGLLTRRLFKANRRAQAMRRGGWGHDTEDALDQELLASLSEDERYLFAVDEARDDPYRPYAPSQRKVTPIRIRDYDGRVFPIEQRSHVARGLADAGYRLRRWYYHPILESKLARLASDRW